MEPVNKQDERQPIKKYEYRGQVNFPQPILAGYGNVSSGGALGTVFLPSSWVVTKLGTGYYRITHNMANDKYVVSVTVISSGPYRLCNVLNKTANQFEVQISTTTFVGSDNAFDFVVYQTP